MAELYLFTQDERKRAEKLTNIVESVLQAAGYSLLDKKKLPPSEEEAIAFFNNADINEEIRTELTEGFSFLSGKLEKKYFYITYRFTDVEISPSEEDRKIFPEEFLKEVKKYYRSVEWQYFTGESKRIAGIRVAEPITEDNPAFALLLWPSFKEMNVEDKTLLQIRKALNLEDHSFIYAPDYFKFVLVISILSVFRKAYNIDLLQAVSYEREEGLIYPIDKINNNFWKTENEYFGTEIGVDFASDEDKKKKISLVGSYSVFFNEEELKKHGISIPSLTPFDKRLYVALGSAGEFTSKRQLYFDTGGTSKDPNQKQLKQISDSLDKMLSGIITIENEEEAKKYNYELFRYRGSLCPIEYVDAIVDGKVVKDVIHKLRPLPLIAFAAGRNQIITVSRETIQHPGISRTNNNIAIEDYLLSRIKWKDGNPKILFEAVFNEVGITEKKQKQRAKSLIIELFEHYKKTGNIKSYSYDSRSISFVKK